MPNKIPLIIAAVASITLFFITDAVAAALFGNNITLSSTSAEVDAALTTLEFSTAPMSLVLGLVAACVPWIIWAYFAEVYGGNLMPGAEHGSARWATKREAKSFMDGALENNIIFTQNTGLALKRAKYDVQKDRNLNVLVLGGSGCGKTRYYLKPNIMQLNANYFITDTKGTTVREVGGMFEHVGYDISYFDVIDPTRSGHYNPFVYLKDELQIITFTECFIENTTGNPNETGDPFWPKAERCGITMSVSYLKSYCEDTDQNMRGLITLVSLADSRDGDVNYMSPLDMLFYELETGMRYVKLSEFCGEGTETDRPFERGTDNWGWVQVSEPAPSDDFALKTYREFNVAAEKTMKSILMSLNVRLKPLTIPVIMELTDYDEMHLDTLGTEGSRSVLFAAMSDSNGTYNFLFSLLLWQTLDLLYAQADKLYAGKLPTPMNFMLDEFANLGKIPNFTQMISTMRSRNIETSILVQSLSQIEENYGENNTKTILNCCDTVLYLGGTENELHKTVSEMLGTQTVRVKNTSITRGSQGSTTTSYNFVERPLATPDEVGRIPRTDAIVMVSGAYPYQDKKFDLTKHKNYELIDPGHKGAKFKEPFDYMEYRNRKEPEAMPA